MSYKPIIYNYSRGLCIYSEYNSIYYDTVIDAFMDFIFNIS